MQKKTHDYDNVFKTMKMKHKRLFVSVINDIFDKNYPLDVRVDVLPSEGYLTAWDIGKATVQMPRFAVIYIKHLNKTPRATTITFLFPDGQKVDYESDNVILEDLTKEYIIQKSCSHTSHFILQGMKRSLYLEMAWKKL